MFDKDEGKIIYDFTSNVLHFGICANDLVLYSSYKDREQIRHALQTGVLYIHWYVCFVAWLASESQSNSR